MKYYILLALFLMLTVPAHADDLFNGMDCNGTTPIPEEYEMAYFKLVPKTETYYLPGETITLGNATSPYVNYVYRDKKFKNKDIPLFGNENITNTLRYLQNTYGQPHYAKDHAYCWPTEDYAICLKRFEFHLAKIGVFCRDQIFKHKESPGKNSERSHQ
ncbi:hypothetical protein [Oceanidesulfovibrio marinus]|uniref:YARHG domain-containing protein n=1 Tax=Oceanidesulfovibrio marinus TaxID=370038 RepID=A0ABX6NE45_9BACT|nr:hypothetical protein [Oceanidesulfovibrio marinus]QJT08333.1 hypothetical protein E8L03_05045 [Oceanidesulfovibrio marinus]